MDGFDELTQINWFAHVVVHARFQATLTIIGHRERSEGDDRCGLQGWFLPTDKNAPARDVYREHGFVVAEERADGSMLWELDLTAGQPGTMAPISAAASGP